MKTKVNLKAKRISETGKRIGTTLLALAMITGVCTPAITSFTQAQPVTKTKKKAKAKKKTKAKKTKSKKKKSYKAKAGTISLSPITLTKGKSKTVSVKTKSKVKWTSSNAKVASVKSISKSKVNVYARKEGSTKVSGKAGSAKWSFTVKVKGKKPIVKPTGKDTKKKTNTSKKKTSTSQKSNTKCDVSFSRSMIKEHDTIKLLTPGDEVMPIPVDSKYWNKIKFISNNPDVLKVKTYYRHDNYPFPPGANGSLCAYKAGKAVITVKYQGGEKKFYITVKEDPLYTAVKGFAEKVKSSNLDEAHKAFVVAKWLEHRAEYKNIAWGGAENLIYGKGGTCEAYASAYHYLCRLTGITVDEAATEDHTWNQIKINGKWYNVDTTNDDSCNDDPLSNETEFFDTEYFMKSDKYTIVDDDNDEIWQPFNNKDHSISGRGGSGNPTATDYDNYDWKPFLQSNEFKDLVATPLNK